MQYFHLADNLHLDKEDKFAKLRPILTELDKKCQENFVAEQEVSIDEAMVPYYGRHSCKQYIHAKPIKFGYKAWVAATRLGYAVAFDFYKGKRKSGTHFGLGEHVVHRRINLSSFF